MEIVYKLVTSPSDILVLIGKKANYRSLHFLYTSENIKKYQHLVTDRTAYQLIGYSPLGKFVGFISSSEKDFFPNYLFLGELFVDQKYQGQGIATSFVQRIIEYAKRKNLEGVVTETELENIPAQKLYEKCGFNIVENPNWQGGTYKLHF